MAVKPARTEENKSQVKLVAESLDAKRARVTSKLTECYIKEAAIEKIKGELKVANNELKEMKDDLKRLAIDADTGQLGFLAEQSASGEGDDD